MKASIAILILLATVLFCSCQRSELTDTKKLIGTISYFKDYKTGLCFAAVNSATYYGYETVSISQVPCTPEVLEQIQLRERAK